MAYGTLQDTVAIEQGRVPHRASQRPRPVAMPYLGAALPIGLIGAAAVALFTLLLDTLAGRPLASPNALGATIFHGAVLDLGAPIRAGYVLAYTLMHGALFVVAAAGAVSAEFTLSKRGVSLGAQFVFGTVGLFLGLLTSFVLMASMSDIRWSAEFGVGRILATNIIAAAAMATAVYRRAVSRRGDLR